MGATVIGRDLGPRVSSSLTSGLTADCTALEIGDYDDAKKSDLFAGKIENIYLNNPDQYMFWPIFDNTVANSQGYIVNDYVYAAE